MARGAIERWLFLRGHCPSDTRWLDCFTTLGWVTAALEGARLSRRWWVEGCR